MIAALRCKDLGTEVLLSEPNLWYVCAAYDVRIRDLYEYVKGIFHGLLQDVVMWNLPTQMTKWQSWMWDDFIS